MYLFAAGRLRLVSVCLSVCLCVCPLWSCQRNNPLVIVIVVVVVLFWQGGIRSKTCCGFSQAKIFYLFDLYRNKMKGKEFLFYFHFI